MFYYYGGKRALAKYYPMPKHSLIIEPFAGSAQYSCLYGMKIKECLFDIKPRQVMLFDKYDVIYDLWYWLINEASKEELLNNIPPIEKGFVFDHLDICKQHKNLLGFIFHLAATTPANKISKMRLGSSPVNLIRKIAHRLDLIRHWEVYNFDYRSIDNVVATWFIDPPYSSGGYVYKHNKIDYDELSDWCRSRKGQVIVCENENNTGWLPFNSLKRSQVSNTGGTRKIEYKQQMEVIWYRENSLKKLKRITLRK